MLTQNKTIVMKAASTVQEDGKAIQVAFMTATFRPDGTTDIQKVIQNDEAFSLYREAVMKDFEEFDGQVYSAILQNVAECKGAKKQEVIDGETT